MRRTSRATAALLVWIGLAASAPAGTVSVGSGSSVDLGTASLALGCADLDVAGTLVAGSVGFAQGRDVTITPTGVVKGSSATLELSGDWDNAGLFDAGTSTVRIVDGCGLLSGVVNGDTSFYDLEIASASGRQMTFTAGSTQTVTGAFEVSGVSGNLLKIRSSVEGEQAYLNVQGTSSASFVDVQDSDALSGNPIALGSESVKGSNTPGWQPSTVIPLLPPLLLAALAFSLVAFGRRALPRWTRAR